MGRHDGSTEIGHIGCPICPCIFIWLYGGCGDMWPVAICLCTSTTATSPATRLGCPWGLETAIFDWFFQLFLACVEIPIFRIARARGGKIFGATGRIVSRSAGTIGTQRYFCTIIRLLDFSSSQSLPELHRAAWNFIWLAAEESWSCCGSENKVVCQLSRHSQLCQWRKVDLL